MSQRDAIPPIVWRPSQQQRESAVITAFCRWLGNRRQRRFNTYEELWEWSVTDLEGFWTAVWEFFDIQPSRPYERALGARRLPGADWFPGARVNYARHIFRSRDPHEIAISHASELRDLSTWSWGDLYAHTAEVAAGLRTLGVSSGDVVAAYMPNIPETVAAFLASASIGAIWSSVAPEFGVRSVVDRLAQLEPTVLLTVDGYRYGGKDFDRRAAVDELGATLPSVRQVVMLDYLGGHAAQTDHMSWADLRKRGRGAELIYEEVPFDHPLWVLFSSGTTGLPKGIVHSQGGILLEHLKVLNLHLDTRAGDRIFWYTTTGWMMWNFLIGCLLTRASIVLFDGSPGYPDLGTLWRLAQASGMTCFGTSASYLSACRNAGLNPGRDHDLSALRAVGSSGSPLSADGFWWVHDHVNSNVWLFSTSGGTDVCTAFVGGVPTLPVYAGEIQARALGANVEAWDEAGRAMIGEVGELVVTEPMPSMPIHLWGDADGSRLRESYFEMFPGVWRHGDWIEITARGSAVIYGRSDSTINRGGVRLGTSEIYRAVLAEDAIRDALVIDIPREQTDGWMPLFVRLRDGAVLDDQLLAAVRRRIQKECSPRHVPDEIYAVSRIPRNLAGKILEIPVKRILMGQPVGSVVNLDALPDPESLDFFIELGRELSARRMSRPL